jgi:hypothetical protein
LSGIQEAVSGTEAASFFMRGAEGCREKMARHRPFRNFFSERLVNKWNNYFFYSKLIAMHTALKAGCGRWADFSNLKSFLL